MIRGVETPSGGRLHALVGEGLALLDDEYAVLKADFCWW
jgi:hypothetical protein